MATKMIFYGIESKGYEDIELTSDTLEENSLCISISIGDNDVAQTKLDLETAKKLLTQLTEQVSYITLINIEKVKIN